MFHLGVPQTLIFNGLTEDCPEMAVIMREGAWPESLGTCRVCPGHRDKQEGAERELEHRGIEVI